MVRIRPNIGAIKRAGYKKGAAGFINKRFAAEAAAAEAAAKRAHDIDLVERRFGFERDENEKKRKSDFLLKQAELGQTSRQNLYTNLVKMAEDPTNDISDVFATVATSEIKLPNWQLKNLAHINRSAKSGDVDSGIKALSQITAPAHVQAGSMFANFVNEKTYTNKPVIKAMSKHFGIEINPKSKWKDVKKALDARQMTLHRSSATRDLADRLGASHIDQTNPISSNFPKIRVLNIKGIQSHFQGTAKENATVDETNNMLAAEFGRIDTDMFDNPYFPDTYRTDPAFRKNIHSALERFLGTTKAFYDNNYAKESDTVGINPKLNNAIKKYMPNLSKMIKSIPGGELDVDAQTSVSKPQSNETLRRRTADDVIEYYPKDPGESVNDSAVEDLTQAPDADKITLRPELLSKSKKTLGAQVFNIDGKLDPMYRLTNANLDQQSNAPKIQQAKELTQMVDDYTNTRQFNTGDDATGKAAAIFNYMEANFSEEIPVDRRIELLTNSVALRLPMTVEREGDLGLDEVVNDDLPQPYIIEKTDIDKYRKQLDTYIDLSQDLNQMLTLVDAVPGVTGAAGTFSMAIVSGISELEGLVRAATDFAGGKISTFKISAVDKLWGRINTNTTMRDGSKVFNTGNATRFHMSKEQFNANLQRLNSAERAELKNAASPKARMSIMDKYRVQKLFEFKKIAMTYRLSGMLQGDGLGGGRTISNADFEVAMKALWGPQKGLKLRLEDFRRNIDAKIKTKRYQLNAPDKRIARIGVNVSDKYRTWHNKTALNKAIFKETDIKNYVPGKDNVLRYKDRLFAVNDNPQIMNNYVKPFNRLSKNTLVKKYDSLAAMQIANSEEDVRSGTMRVRQNTPEGKFLANIAILAKGLTQQYMAGISQKYNKNSDDLNKRAAHTKIMTILKNKNQTAEELQAVYSMFFTNMGENTYERVVGGVAASLFAEMKQGN